MVRVVGSPTGQILRATCSHCLSRLEYLPKEVQVLKWVDNSDTPSGHEYIVCPACGEKVVLKQW